jgi:hypothetical protein
MLLSETLVKYSVAVVNGEKVVTYFMESPLGTTELGTIALDLGFDTEDKMVMLQLFVTPHVHNALLDSIIPVIEKIAAQTDGGMRSSLEGWLLQARSILNPPA